MHNFNSSVVSFSVHLRHNDEMLNPKREDKLLYINVDYQDTEMHSLLLFIRFALYYVTTIMLIAILLLSKRNKVFMRQSMGNISWCWIPLLGYPVAQNAIILVTWESTSSFLRLIYPEIRIYRSPFVSDTYFHKIKYFA